MTTAIDSSTEEHRDDVSTYVELDLARCLDGRLHLLVGGILTITLGVTAAGIASFSAAFGTEVTLPEFIATLTINAAWFYFSLFALVGLFVAYPGHQWQPDGTRRAFTTTATRFQGTLVSRWLLLSGATVVAFIVPLLLGAIVFEEFSVVAFLGLVVLTVLALCAYASIGIGLAAVTQSDGRLVFWLLAVYWVLVFLWETSLIPLVVAIGVSGDAEGSIGTPSTVHDALLAMSPGGAHSTLANALVDGSAGTVEVIGALSLVAWLVLPPLLGWLLVTRR